MKWRETAPSFRGLGRGHHCGLEGHIVASTFATDIWEGEALRTVLAQVLSLAVSLSHSLF